MSVDRIFQIVAAHQLEIKNLRRCLGLAPFTRAGPQEFLSDGLLVEILLCGVGAKDIAPVLSSHGGGRRVDLAINIGFAGGLQEDIERGSWIMCGRVCRRNSDGCLEELVLGAPGLAEAVSRHFSGKGIGLRIGGLATVNEVCSGKENRGVLAAETRALAVDMEGYDLALMARKRGIPFLALKVISDTVSESPEKAVRLRGNELSRHIAEVIPDLLVKLAVLDEDKCGYSNL